MRLSNIRTIIWLFANLIVVDCSTAFTQTPINNQRTGPSYLRKTVPSSFANSNDDNANYMPTPSSGRRVPLRLPPLDSPVPSKEAGESFLDKLLKISNVASMLCVLDCTILPAVTILFPLIGLASGSPGQMEFLHELGHKMALFFVLPVAGLATTMNYVRSHRKIWITSIGWLGMALVFAANAGGSCCAHHHHHHVAVTGSMLQKMLLGFWNSIHHGVAHRVANLSGCGLLLTSNFLSQQAAKKFPSGGYCCENC